MKILVISWPKSGTHAAIEICRRIHPSLFCPVEDLKYSSVDQLLFEIARFENLHPSGVLLKGHLEFDQRILEFVRKRNFKVLFLTRDPRDIICSTFSWLRQLRKQWEISEYFRGFSDDEVISKLIRGVPELFPFNLDHGIDWDRPLPERYAKLNAWQQSSLTLAIRFEDICRNAEPTTKLETIKIIAGYLDCDIGSQALRNGIDDSQTKPASQTFFSGKSGQWKELFTAEHLKLFCDLGGESLVETFNYESSNESKLKRSKLDSAKATQPTQLSRVNEIAAYMRSLFKIGIRKSKDMLPGIRFRKLLQRLEAVEKVLDSDASTDSLWLFKNRFHRMDALLDHFPSVRRFFHLARYDFASDFCMDKRVADIACGTGYGSHMLSRLGSASEVLGVDLDSRTIEYAQRRYGSPTVTFQQGDACHTKLPDESFDVVTSFETIEHVPLDEDLINEFHRLLTPNGKLIVSTPNEWPLETAEFHVRSYSHAQFIDVLSRKFSVQECYNQYSNAFEKWSSLTCFEETNETNKGRAECFVAVCEKV